MDEQVNYKHPPQATSHLSHLASQERDHAAFSLWATRLHSRMCADTIAYSRQAEPQHVLYTQVPTADRKHLRLKPVRQVKTHRARFHWMKVQVIDSLDWFAWQA